MEHLALHARQRRLLYFLNGCHGVVTGHEIAERIEASERTVRNDIARINQVLEPYRIHIRAVYGKGYVLEIGDRSVFHMLFSEKDNIQTKEDRIRYLIVKLVRNDGPCDIRNLEEDIYISRTTLENDLREVRSRVMQHQPYLKMERRGNLVSFEEDEMKRRNILIRLYCENWDYDSRNGIVVKDEVIDQEILDQIRIVVKDILKKYRILLDDFGLVYLILTLAVCYQRILDGKLLEEVQWKEKIRDAQAAEAAAELLDRMSGLWELEVEPAVYEWLKRILGYLSNLNFCRYTKAEAQERVTQQCQEVTKSLMAQMKQQYLLDFGEEEDFYVHMLFHVQALMDGIISVQTQSRYILDELRLKHPFLGDIAHFLCSRLEELCGIETGTDEENYLLPLLVMAQNQALRKNCHLRAAVVSHMNFALTHQLMEDIESFCRDRIELLGPFPIYDRERMEQQKTDCILTTVRMDVFRRFDVPVIIVSPLLTEKDRENIDQCIRKAEEKFLYPPLLRERFSYFHSELMLEIDQKLDFAGVMELLEEKLRCGGYLREDHRTDWSSHYCTVLKHGMLFSYLIGEEAQETAVSMASLKHTVIWKQSKNIKKVMLVLLNPKERQCLGSFYRMAEEFAQQET